MLANRYGSRLNKYVEDYCVFDLETTGISYKTDRVVEISALKVIKGEVVDEFSSLVNPLMPIPFYASQVNGITDDMVADSPVFEELLDKFIDFASDMILVGNNIHSFDMKFLYRDAKVFYDKMIDNDYIDTLQLSRVCLPQLSHHKLTDLSQYYGISTEGAHRALNDCYMNYRVFEELGKGLANPVQNSQIRLCPRCKSTLIKRKGKYGEFLGCTSYPMCKYTENVT